MNSQSSLSCYVSSACMRDGVVRQSVVPCSIVAIEQAMCLVLSCLVEVLLELCQYNTFFSYTVQLQY